MNKRLFENTLKHPVVGLYVEFVSPEWVLELANPVADDKTDLGHWKGEDLVTLDALFDDMLDRGMRDPFILSAGRVDRYLRLEAGNHRVKLMVRHKVPLIPVVVYVNDKSIVYEGNGVHKGKLFDLRLPEQIDIMGPYPIREYKSLSDVMQTTPEHWCSAEQWKKRFLE